MLERVSTVGDATSLSDWKRRAGQRLIIGFEHPHLDDDARRVIREVRPAGFILFKRNVESPEQVRELNRELIALTDAAYPPLLTVDQEGGRVQRVREPATVWPSMRVVGQAGADMVTRVSTAMALELRAMGFNLNFAPDADVDSNPKNPVIGDRSFGRSPNEVAAAVKRHIEAHQAAGVIACAKHFPGHGDTAVDSHLELPIVEKERPEIEQCELVPFRAAVEAKVGSVMTAHVVYPAYDEDLPATLSPRIIPEILRRKLGYTDGLVFSDDLEMKAVMGRWPLERQIALMTANTVDVLLCCRSPQLQLEAFEHLVAGQQYDKSFAERTRQSVRRLTAVRERFFVDRSPDPSLDLVGCPSHVDLALLARARGDG
jgi:beta-N-acetylhexosaminidase